MQTISTHAAKKLKELQKLEKVTLRSGKATHYTTTNGTFNQTCYICLIPELLGKDISIYTLRNLKII